MIKDTHIPPFMEEGLNAFKQFKFSGVDTENLMSTYQKNLELMNAAQQITVETAQSVAELHNQFMKNAIAQWNDQIKYCYSKAPLEEKTTYHAEATKAAVDHVIEHTRALNSIIAQSNAKLNETLQKRFKEGLDDSINMTKKSKEKR
ncbi:MAG: TIGR01841 family phasin [Alphaproteobacteria bacterium]|nr:TIGR01841 family phasin [Alphaproteobacteria bacterium]